MITEDLYSTVLLEPATQSSDVLYIVSGYATASMASRHVQSLKQLKKNVKIELIVGMVLQDGLSVKDHTGFRDLVGTSGGAFSCRYVIERPIVHSKVYTWHSGGNPKLAYVGSANYTQSAFSTRRREALAEANAALTTDYFKEIYKDTLDCLDPQTEEKITIYTEPEYSLRRAADNDGRLGDLEEPELPIVDRLARLPHVKVNLLDRQGRLPEISGLNWGQRSRREPNQAYIRIPMAIARTDFFPAIGAGFTIITDDGQSLLCARAQAGGKAIHTTQNNSVMGVYFRNRLGLASGAFVKRSDLDIYGRSDLDFYRIDEETYYMDFSV